MKNLTLAIPIQKVYNENGRVYLGGELVEISEIVGIISSVGFPIVACGAMAYYIGKKMDPILDVMNQVKALLHDINDKEG